MKSPEPAQRNSYKKLISWRHFCPAVNARKIMHDGSLQADKWVYHFLPWCYAKRIFEHGRLRLSPVGSWTDPYEKWWCHVLFREPSKLAKVHAYGLCWTTSSFDEPTWRIAGFGRNGPIVRIRCCMRVLLQAGRGLIEASPGSLFLGAVRYCPTKTLLGLAQTASSRKEVSRMAATMLLHKRAAFRFEKEVRLLWLDKEPAKDEIFLKLDPVTAISQVMTSPYATSVQHEEIKGYLEKRGVQSKQSGVLQAPKLNLQ